MARGKWCSYKRITIFVCAFNIIVALYVLHSLYANIYIYSADSQKGVKYTPDQIRRMEEAIKIRKAAEPKELVKLVKKLEKQFSGEDSFVELPSSLKQKIMDEILQKLKGLNSENVTEHREAVERWRKDKLKEAKMSIFRTASNSSMPLREADVVGVLVRALEVNWARLLEEIGVYMPVDVVHKEHDDKPEGAEEIGTEFSNVLYSFTKEVVFFSEETIIPGRPLPPECHAEVHTDYAGAAVRWGLTHHTESAADCCQACLDHARNARPGQKKCNIWVYCPSEAGCYSPDIYEHKNQECWLKYAEKPRLNFKDKYSESYRNSHPTAPLYVPWISGVISA
ncbi:hypothetical protein RJ641_032214 [Dillenia turbinata]|uniref:Apple domain-containing protein n=1 Tax=Dillenia turbinata TaxID=194707 RepID=A0AAN8VZ43_9MAGN